MKRLLPWLLPLVAGCSTLDLPKLSNKEVLAAAAVVYYTHDGFRWEVEDRRIGPDLYRITVRQGKLTRSGQGEAEPIFRRRAEEIVATQGCAGYTILEYTQGLAHDALGVAQRVSEGVIRCHRPAGTITGGETS
ncbi:MAG: hypothetical protein K6T56_03045 [Burkholderiales bacterium]|jgi:hypothetical protein|nr:hypothetical protein [Burkholderiales bacterium]